MAGYITVCSQAVWQQGDFKQTYFEREWHVGAVFCFFSGGFFSTRNEDLKVKVVGTFCRFGKRRKGGNRWPLSKSGKKKWRKSKGAWIFPTPHPRCRSQMEVYGDSPQKMEESSWWLLLGGGHTKSISIYRLQYTRLLGFSQIYPLIVSPRQVWIESLKTTIKPERVRWFQWYLFPSFLLHLLTWGKS